MKNIKSTNAPEFCRHLQIISTLANVDYLYPFEIWEKLNRLENKANRICTAQCNGEGNQDKQNKQLEHIEKRVLQLLPNLEPENFFINGDPRGYSLKIKESKATELKLHKDWGGYGILTPQF